MGEPENITLCVGLDNKHEDLYSEDWFNAVSNRVLTKDDFVRVAKGISHNRYLFPDGLVYKPCSACLTWKPVGRFQKDKKSFTGRVVRCRDCANACARENRVKRFIDPTVRAARNSQMTENLKRKKEAAVAYKGGKCEDCGLVYPSYVFDFHHLDGSLKSDNPSALIRNSWDSIKEEIDSCLLLCANCHRERHYGKT